MRYPPTSSSPRRFSRSTFARKSAPSTVTRKAVRIANREEKAFDVFIKSLPWMDRAEEFRWVIDIPARRVLDAFTQPLTEASGIASVTDGVFATVTDQIVMQGRDGAVPSCLGSDTHDGGEEQVRGKLHNDGLAAKGHIAGDGLEMLDLIITVTRPGESDVLKKISLEDTATSQTLPVDVQRILLECMCMAGSTGTIVIARSIVIAQPTELKDSFPGIPNSISHTLSDTSPPAQARLNSPMPPNGFLSTSSNIFLGAPARDAIYTTSGAPPLETMPPDLMESTSSTLSKSFLSGLSGGTGYDAPSEASVSSGFRYISFVPLGLIPATSSRRNSRAVSRGVSLELSRDSLDVPLITPRAAVSAPSRDTLAISSRTSVLDGTSRLYSLGYAPFASMGVRHPATADAILTYRFMDPTPSGSTAQGDAMILGSYPENHTFGAGVGTTGTSWPAFAFRMDIPTLKRRISLQAHKTQVSACLPKPRTKVNPDKNRDLGSVSSSENSNTTRIKVEGSAVSPSALMSFSIPTAISGTGAPSFLKRKLETIGQDDSLPSGYMWPDITKRQQRDDRSACDACEAAPRDMAKAFAVYCNHYIP